MKSLCLLVVVAGCTDTVTTHPDLYYAWDTRRVLCSAPIDDLAKPIDFTAEEARFREAADRHWVTLIHAHEPGGTVSLDAIERVLGWADKYHLDYVPFSELTETAQHRAGLAFAFDDTWIDQWYGIRDMLDAHHARVTFFISKWQTLTPAQQDEVKQLAADGHDIEPHTVHHLNATDYVAANGIDAYLANEVLPSFQMMKDAGYPPTSFAYPFGAHTDAIDQAVLQYIDRVRTTPGECPPATAGEY